MHPSQVLFIASDFLNQVPTVPNLPNSDTFYSEFFNMAWTQILLWCSAASGALITIWIIKSFVNR